MVKRDTNMWVDVLELLSAASLGHGQERHKHVSWCSWTPVSSVSVSAMCTSLIPWWPKFSLRKLFVPKFSLRTHGCSHGKPTHAPCVGGDFFSSLFEISRWKPLIQQVNKPFRAHSDEPSGPKPSEAAAAFFSLLLSETKLSISWHQVCHLVAGCRCDTCKSSVLPGISAIQWAVHQVWRAGEVTAASSDQPQFLLLSNLRGSGACIDVFHPTSRALDNMGRC